MFGLILPSRPVLTVENLITISPTQCEFIFPRSPGFSHIVVFLIPGNVLPIDSAAAVYVQFPGKDFKLLGAVDNEKPTAFFKVTGGDVSSGEIDMDADINGINDDGLAGNVTVGISIELGSTIAPQLATIEEAEAEPSSSTALTLVKGAPTTKVLAQRIIKNAFNFLASFVEGQGGNEVVPLKSFQAWWSKFERRIENDPGFLERDEAS
ncbi:hypothetical protein MMC09_000702 [Bachmanniomyces sp. S44760]|nr:hypothetical protein [Bachmanniomyces sp. S44760]